MPRLSLLAVLFASPLVAADLDVTVKPVYYQTIKPRAFVDGRGTVWFSDKTAVHDATGKKVAVRPSEHHQLILADKAGRFWFWNPYDPVKTGLVYSVGNDVIDTKLASPVRADRGSSTIAIHEDSAGRVFVRTPKAVHVLSPDGKWDALGLFETASIGFTGFVEDPKGRTWMWVTQNQPKVQGGAEGTVGAWCHDGKGWKQHAPADGFPFEQVEYVLPFADDWFIVIEHVDEVRNGPKPGSKLWSPSRTAKQIAESTAFADLPTYAVKYLGTDLDGNRYLSRPYAAHDGVKHHEATMVRVSPKGEVKLLDGFGRGKKGKAVASDSILKQPVVMTDPMLPMLARPADPTMLYPETSSYDCLGRDKDGRIWFRHHYGDVGSFCLWPAQEKPGDILRMTAVESNRKSGYRSDSKRGLVVGTDGKAWSVGEGVEAWDGKTWTETPVKPFRESGWMMRFGPPPEYHLANFHSLTATPTTAGGSVVSLVKTKYEGTVAERGFPKPKGEDEVKVVDPKAPFYKFETTLLLDNRWGEPGEPMKVLKAQAKELIRTLNVDRAEPRPVSVCSDGKRLWVAFDWKLHAVEADGTTTTVELPQPEKRKPGAALIREPEMPPLMLASLLTLAENKVLLVTQLGARVATFRTTKVREVSLTDVAGAANSVEKQGAGDFHPPRIVDVPFTLQRDKAGTVWGWTGYEALYRFDGEKFAAMKNTRGPMAVTDDGVLWCYPPVEAKLPPGNKRPVTLVRVCGDSVEKFTWKPEEIELGFTKPPKGSAVVWPSEYGLLCVESQAKAGERPVLRRRTLAESMGSTGVGPPFVVTGDGHILFSGHWGQLFEPKK